MSLTKEMITSIENEISQFDNTDLVIYYHTYKHLNEQYPNSYYKFRVQASLNEIVNRGIEDEKSM